MNVANQELIARGLTSALSPRMIFIAPLVVSFALAAAPPPSPAPTAQEKEQAVAVLVKLWEARTEEKDPQRLMLGMGIAGIVNDLAGVTATDTASDAKKKVDAAVASLKAKQKIDAAVPVATILAEFAQLECRTKQSEAKGNLKAIYVAEESHRAEFDEYSNDFKKIFFAPKGSTIRYRYEIVSLTKTTFLARAVGTGEMAGDEWTISDQNDLKNTKSSCRGP